MLTKRLLTISLVLPLAAISAAAFAGSTITDKSYWPGGAHDSAQSVAVGPRGDVSSAFAYDRTPSRLQPVAPASGARVGRHYQGGPKAN